MDSGTPDHPAPVKPASPTFLDVPTLLERSVAPARGHWMWYGTGAFVLVVLASALISRQSELAESLVTLVSSLLLLLLFGGVTLLTWHIARQRRAELQQIEALEELVHLRRWDEAAAVLERLLSSPTRTPQARIHGLLYLATVLARYHRFDDAVRVHNYLIEHVELDPASDYALRLGRAMSMLRADHLFDADRAIADLRRTAATEEEASGGLALIEIYRDVKTGHPDEAIQIFEQKLPAIQKQLGTRVADAYALAARSYDLLGRSDEAARAFENATMLAPMTELARRYPEVAPLAQKFVPTPSPLAQWTVAEPGRVGEPSTTDDSRITNNK